MHTKQYLIIDDSPQDAEYVASVLTPFTFYKLAAVAPTLEEAVRILDTQHIDLIFLDVRLAGQSGLTLLRTGMKLPPVIVMSSFSEYAVDSYEIGQAADYLLKPFTADRLQLALARALRLPPDPSGTVADPTGVFLKAGRKIQRFGYDSIDYVQAYGVYSKVHEGPLVHLVNERLLALDGLLPPRYFIRVHKSYILNINKITSFERRYFWVGKSKIPIGVSYRPRLSSLLGLFNADDAKRT